MKEALTSNIFAYYGGAEINVIIWEMKLEKNKVDVFLIKTKYF